MISLIAFKRSLAFFTLALTSSIAYSQEIVAHRGASHNAPENTIASVRLAYMEGADAVEIDALLSKDNRIMVSHDKNTKRTGGGEGLLIRETHSDVLRKLDVGVWKSPEFTGEKMPFLEEILELIPSGKKLVIELKTGPEILPVLKETIDDYDKPENLILISFGLATIVSAKKLFPDIPAYWLLGSFEKYTVEEAIKIAKDSGLEGLDVDYRLVAPEFMKKMNAANLEVYAYTVNDAAVANQLAGLKVKGITTDKPAWLKEQLK